MQQCERPKDVLLRVAKRYSKLRSYSDVGNVRALFGDRPFPCTFRTAFRGPKAFRFSFDHPHPYAPHRHHVAQYAVGVDRAGPYFFSKSYSGKEDLERGETIEMFLAGATGISRGAAHTIGSLLFPEIGGFELSRLRRARRWKPGVYDGTHCVGIAGYHPAGGLVVAHFGSADLLLRRLVYHRLKHMQLRTRVSTIPRHVEARP